MHTPSFIVISRKIATNRKGGSHGYKIFSGGSRTLGIREKYDRDLLSAVIRNGTGLYPGDPPNKEGQGNCMDDVVKSAYVLEDE